MVYILDINGNPLMPTERHGKVRRLLDSKQAKVVKRCPFTIQLLYETSRYTQEIVLGIDAGSKMVGVSATTKQKELLSAELEMVSGKYSVTKKLADRLGQRKTRRRKLRYRPARFSNRKRPKGWIAPTIRQKIETHMSIIRKVHQILPVSRIVVEVAQFDNQKIKNPDISGIEYQHGEQFGFWNVREFVLSRDEHKCQNPNCKCKSEHPILNVHHIESRKTGGDAPNNLITLCEECHKGYHKGTVQLELKRGDSFRDSAFMGIMMPFLYEKLKEIYPDVKLTYGYITKNTRIRNGIEKTHCADALCITGNPQAKRATDWYYFKKRKCHDRKLQEANLKKGGVVVPAGNPYVPYILNGFRIGDYVYYTKDKSKRGFVSTKRADGVIGISTIDGKLIKSPKFKYVKLIEARDFLPCERRLHERSKIETA